MPANKSRLSRLTAIVTQLQSKRISTARELAERHDVSIRTIYRDIRALEASGIPILTEEGKGYSLMDGYNLPPIMFTEEEANALLIAEHILLRNKDESLVNQYQNAITKIKAVLHQNLKKKSEFLAKRLQVRNNATHDKTSNYLITLQSTIANFTVVEIDYLSLEDRFSQRVIEPFALYTTNDNWLLIAFCRSRQDFRAFRLDRIQRLRSTSAHFEPHPITLEEYFEACRQKYLNTPDIGLTSS